jgi:hypothetical protein
MRRTPIYALTQPHSSRAAVGRRVTRRGSLVFREAAFEADVSTSGSELRGDAGLNPEAASIGGHFKCHRRSLRRWCPCLGRDVGHAVVRWRHEQHSHPGRHVNQAVCWRSKVSQTRSRSGIPSIVSPSG